MTTRQEEIKRLTAGRVVRSRHFDEYPGVYTVFVREAGPGWPFTFWFVRAYPSNGSPIRTAARGYTLGTRRAFRKGTRAVEKMRRVR